MTIPFLPGSLGHHKGVRAVAGERVPGQLAGRGSCGNLLSLGTRCGSLPSLAADHSVVFGFVNKKDSHWRRGLDWQTWVAAPPLASGPSLGSYPRPVLSAIAAPNTRSSPVQWRCPDDTKKAPDAQNLAATLVKWPHTEKRYAPRFQVETAIIRSCHWKSSIACSYVPCGLELHASAVYSEALSFGDPPMPLGHSQLARNQQQSIVSVIRVIAYPILATRYQ